MLDWKVSPYDAIKDQSKHSFWVSFGQMQADIKDVSFCKFHLLSPVPPGCLPPAFDPQTFAKKRVSQSLPTLVSPTSSSVAKASTARSTSSRRVGRITPSTLSTSRSRCARFFLLKSPIPPDSLPSQIEKLSFKLRDNKHKLIIAMFKTLFTNLLRKGIAKAIENGIRSGLVQLDAQLADIQERVEAAIEDEDTSTVEALASAFDFKKSQAQRKKDSVTREPFSLPFHFITCFFRRDWALMGSVSTTAAGKFNITANTRDSLVDWSSPHSLVDKITEKEALATQASHEWHSPAFDSTSRWFPSLCLNVR